MRAEKRGLFFVISWAGLWWTGCGLVAGRAVVGRFWRAGLMIEGGPGCGRPFGGPGWVKAGQAVMGRLAGQKIVAVMGRGRLWVAGLRSRIEDAGPV